jgi:hypothetical protein
VFVTKRGNILLFPNFLVCPCFDCSSKWKAFQCIKFLYLHVHNQIQMCCELISQFIHYEGQSKETLLILNALQNHSHRHFDKLQPFGRLMRNYLIVGQQCSHSRTQITISAWFHSSNNI